MILVSYHVNLLLSFILLVLTDGTIKVGKLGSPPSLTKAFDTCQNNHCLIRKPKISLKKLN